MFEELMDSLNLGTVILTLAFSAVFWGMIWFIPTWEGYSVGKRVVMSVVAPIILYYIISLKTAD